MKSSPFLGRIGPIAQRAEDGILIGQTVSHYQIIRQMGGGGMGVVYEAEDLRLGRKVALKFLPEGMYSDPRSLERFRREARATSLLNHPNICTIFDIEEHEGRPFIVMELLEGDTVKDLLAARPADHKPLPLNQVLDVGIQVADALEVAHARGIIHRDIKPANIFITRRGQAKVLDFGLAKLTPQLLPTRAAAVTGAAEDAGGTATMVKEGSDSSASADDLSGLTALGSIPGTVAYMSPEQVRNEELDCRSDLFSLGVVLYEIATGQKPFSGTSPVLVMAAVIERKPVSPSSLNREIPTHLEAAIAKAMEKSREKRYQTAAELRTDLQWLKRESDSGVPAAGGITTLPKGVFRTTSSKARILYLVSAGLLLMIAVVLALVLYKRQAQTGARAAANTLAVLPFQNLSPDKSDDFLRIALADEITTILTYTRTLEVRPATSAAKYADGSTEPDKAGRELHVADVITGHFIHAGDKLEITLQAIEVANNRVVWEGSVNVAANNRLEMQQALKQEVRQGLVPVITNTASGALETASRPQNQEAYELYLRSVAVPHDAEPNREAINMLERSVGMDSGYAPAWDALGLRYYFESSYGGGGGPAFDRAMHAYERAVAIDPNFLLAASHLAVAHIEQGDLVSGYKTALELVQRRPDSAQAHFTLSYILRYAGLLQDSTRECEVARAQDPGNYQLRSCAFAFAELGKEAEAMKYINLDAGSEWSADLTPFVLLRRGDISEARMAADKVKDDNTWQGTLLQACLAPGAAVDMTKLDHAVQQRLPQLLAQRDPEFRYLYGSMLGFCGEREPALQLLQSAIDSHYCAREALSDDPLLEKLRAYPEFKQLQSASQSCLQKFLAAR